MKYFFTACIVFVVFALGVGLYFSGTPGSARAERLDDVRVSNLASIQNSILSFYSSQKKLPTTMSEVVKIEVANFYTDPETKVLYEYTKKSDTEFSLCATFARESMQESSQYPYYYSEAQISGIVGNNSWKHAAGRVCFDRVVDPRLVVPSLMPVKG